MRALFWVALLENMQPTGLCNSVSVFTPSNIFSEASGPAWGPARLPLHPPPPQTGTDGDCTKRAVRALRFVHMRTSPIVLQ